jgi:hypothetical protein
MTNVQVFPAGPAVAVMPLAGGRVAGLGEAGKALDVHVQQGPGPRPLIAPVGLALPAWVSGEAVAVKDLPNRRARPPTDPRQAAGTETGLPAGTQDRRLLGSGEPARLAMGRAGPVAAPGAREPLRIVCLAPAVPPAVGCGRRDVEGGSCRPQRHPRLDRFHQRQPSRWSESGVTVNLHPGPPCLGRQRPQASGRARMAFQLFTRCVGGSARPYGRPSRAAELSGFDVKVGTRA